MKDEMKDAVSLNGRFQDCEPITCSVEIAPGKGGKVGSKPIICEIPTGTMQWLKEQEKEQDKDEL